MTDQCNIGYCEHATASENASVRCPLPEEDREVE